MVKELKEQFVPYHIAKGMKEIGYDEINMSYYFADGVLYNGLATNKNSINNNDVSAPLWQQAIKWFEMKHTISIDFMCDDYSFKWIIVHVGLNVSTEDGGFDTKEKAMIHVLETLINMNKKVED